MLSKTIEGSYQFVLYRQALWRGRERLMLVVTRMICFYGTRVGSRLGCCLCVDAA